MTGLDNKKKLAIQLLEAIDEADLLTIQKMLADGCPTSHPEVTQSALMYALQSYARTPIVNALADAGAPLTFGTPDGAPQERITARNIRKIFERGEIHPEEVDPLFSYATWQGWESIAIRLLEVGANPMYRDQEGLSYPLENATDLGMQRLPTAITQRMTQLDKDTLLAHCVRAFAREAKIRCVRLLLDAGADAAQRVNGRTLVQIAPAGAEDLKRLLRSAKTGQSLEQAMGSSEAQAPAPARPSHTL